MCAGGVACFVLLNKLFFSVAAASKCCKCFCSEIRFIEYVSTWQLLTYCSLHEQTKGKVVLQHLECDFFICPMM